MSTKPKPTEVEDVDEDLDDLDDVISEFAPSSKKPEPPSVVTPTKQPDAASSSSSLKAKAPIPPTSDDLDNLIDDDFAKELAQGMESLMRELAGIDDTPGAKGEDGEELTEEQKVAFKAAWEKMLIDELDQGSHPLTGDAPIAEGIKETVKGKIGPTNKESTSTSYQSSLKQAMDSVRESEELFKNTNPGDGSEDALFKQILELSKGDINEDDSDELQDMLMGMLNTILSKDVLYEPIIDLRDKFPAYLAENSSKLPKEDLDRYKLQLECVTELGKIFDDPQYNDKDEQTKARVSTLVEKLQGYGSPPKELTGPIPPGLPGADIPEGCIIS